MKHTMHKLYAYMNSTYDADTFEAHFYVTARKKNSYQIIFNVHGKNIVFKN